MDPDRPDSKSDFYRTPNLEQLAHEGMIFSNAYAPGPMCSPTRASIQTGKSPAQLHMTDIIEGGDREHDRYKRFYVGKPLVPPLPRTGLPHDEVTIAEFIKSNRPEYRTAHFGKWHLGADGPGEHGYDVHDGDTGNFNGLSGDPDPKETFSVTERASEFMERHSSRGEPFFMQVSYYALHTPIRALEASAEAFESRTPGERHSHVGHAAMTWDLDTGVGMLLDKIEELGIADETYVVYFSDNGAYADRYGAITNNLPLSEGKGHTREGGIRVPLVIRGPNIEPGVRSDEPVIGWDFLPTIRSWLSIEAPLPPGVEGGDFSPLLTKSGAGEVRRPRKALVWHYPHYIDARGVVPQSALRLGAYKLIYEYETDEHFLYDLENDLEESHNLARERPGLAESLRIELEAYLQHYKAELPQRHEE